MPAQHTPGPWEAYCQDVTGERPAGDSGRRFWLVSEAASEGPYRGSVASVHDAAHINGISVAERDANARLIAAAPEMADELEVAASIFERYAQLHHDKGTEDGKAKGDANAAHARRIRDLLAKAKA